MARILVTGGDGVVGRPLVRALRSRGNDVFVCDLKHSEKEAGFSLRTDVLEPQYARCDVGEIRELRRVFDAFGPFDFVYHMAAEFGRWNGEDFYEKVWRTNAVGTKNVIRLQEQLGFKLIHFSSSEVYGDWEGTMVEEVMDKHEIRQMNDYALSKWVNEQQVRNSAIQFGTKSVIVRLFNTYGPGEFYSPYRSVNCRFIYCALRGIPWVVFRGHYRTSTYIDQTVDALAKVSETFKAGEVYNISSDQFHSIEELSDLIVDATGADRGLVEYRDSEILTTRVKKVESSKAKRDLGLSEGVNLKQGIARTVEWMRSVYN